jgi:hypothetical protein
MYSLGICVWVTDFLFIFVFFLLFFLDWPTLLPLSPTLLSLLAVVLLKFLPVGRGI